MTSCASFSTNSPKTPAPAAVAAPAPAFVDSTYDDTLHADVIALSRAINGPILAIDTAGSEASVCLVHGTLRRVVESVSDARSLPCETLAQSIHDVLAGRGLQVKDLAALVVSVGPGSFTGLRVGLATCQGFSLGAGVPIYGVSSLAVLAASAGPGRVSPVCDARRGDVFAALYDIDAHGRAEAVIGDNVFATDAWAETLGASAQADTVIVGDMAQAMHATCGRQARAVPRRALLCVVQAAQAIRAGDATAAAALLPRYLRLSEAERQLAAQPKVA